MDLHYLILRKCLRATLQVHVNFKKLNFQEVAILSIQSAVMKYV